MQPAVNLGKKKVHPNYVLLTLIGLHIVAGLYHYFIRRDGVFERMLPGR
jgi:cytochrome b561